MAALIPPTPDQEMLRISTARFVEASCPLSEVRSLIADTIGFRRSYVENGGELGWFAMLVPPQHGGGSVSDRPLMDLALIAAERGRTLQPGPMVASNVVAHALAEYGSDDQRARYLPELASGGLLATTSLAGVAADCSATGMVATAATGGYVLSGISELVPDACAADLFLITATINSTRALAQYIVKPDVPGLTTTPLQTLDLTRKLGRIELSDVAVPESARLGTSVDSAAAYERQFQVSVALSVAETLGTMNCLFEFTLQYAKDRYAFGRSIGSFQAIKHLLADLSLLLEASKAGATAAINAVQDLDPAAAEIISAVKAFVSEAATELAQGCLQIHGGIGYTWEHDLHLYYRRLAGDRFMYGDPAWHRERICALHRL
ncbi:acyl-CoA dehydrogenase family protein [Mycobacterium marseillense]|uniref:acyl-CoA dehydrogenase family protein n=1 Tax=Mycobacterium marseillense TaxID=701042 RepID=UPI0011A7721C|nr:acyl-CoA dehydrogenase family protein [Mycobacterium marseillense]